MIEAKKFKNLLEVLDFFKEESTCKLYLEQQRWNGKVCCPFCKNEKVYRTNRGFKCASPTCYKKFTVLVGTPFENTKIKLRYWFAAIYLISAHKKGISSHQLARDLGIAQSSAWFLNHRIRQMLKENSPELMTGEVQMDETYIGGKTKNMHKWKRDIVNAAGTGGIHMNPVFGMSNKGKVNVMPVPEANGVTLRPIIMENVAKGSTIVTDGHGSYAGLNKHFTHIIVNHEDGEFVKDGFSTNQAENFWSVMKRGIYGIYHHVSGKHLERYCDEFTYRYNTREVSSEQRFHNVLANSNGGRITYEKLTAK